MTPSSTDDAAMVSRLRVSVSTGRIAPEVASWALRHAVRSPASVRRHRDLLLLDAANAFDGSLWSRAEQIHATLERLRAGRLVPAPGSPEALVAAAHALDATRPGSVRQVFRVISGDY
mgnify:CR=1 FL=1